MKKKKRERGVEPVNNVPSAKTTRLVELELTTTSEERDTSLDHALHLLGLSLDLVDTTSARHALNMQLDSFDSVRFTRTSIVLQ